MELLFESKRDNPNIERWIEIASDMYHEAGAHLLAVRSDPKAPKFKVPVKAKWSQERDAWDDIETHMRKGGLVGIMSPAKALGISCVDIDNGVAFRVLAVDGLGVHPLVAYESSRTKPGRCHAWWYTPEPFTINEWAGGDIYSGHSGQVIIYNWDAFGAAWDIAKAGNAKPVNLLLLQGVKGRSQHETAYGDDGGGEEAEITDDMITNMEDAEVPTVNRHKTMIKKIGRAVEECSTKRELDQRVMVITDAHRKALADEEDAARKASLRTEIASAKAFADAAWAKKGAAKPVREEIKAAVKVWGTKEEAWAAVLFEVKEYAKLCQEHRWPNPDQATDDMHKYLDIAWANKLEREEQANAVIKHQKEADERANAIANRAMESGLAFTITLDAPWGTKQSWVEATERLGIKFRHNTFSEHSDVWIPENLFPKNLGGGQWTQMTDHLRAVISMAIENHTQARASFGKNTNVLKPVELNKHKEQMARDFMFASNRWCPMRDYFESLPPWCGEHIIHNSMERGGMMVDAGPFTEAAQAFLWLFVVRNCLYPGSGMREYIVLHGDHDCGKSKFVELALPPHLKQYYNGGFSLDGSLKVKLERSIGKALLECGEMGQGGAKDWNAVKQWLTLSEVSGERMAYKEFAKRHKLTATTIFTTNMPELPPTDDAVLSRFIWVNVKTRADRAKDVDGNDIELVWQHFDQLYDPARPELGTWREQYFAQAYAIVKGSVRTLRYSEEGVEQVREECNPQWLPPGAKAKLVAWNKQAGSTYNTDQSSLVDHLETAIELLGEFYGYDTLEGLYPTPELRAAIAASEDGVEFESWFDLQNSLKEHGVDKVAIENKIKRIRTGVPDRAIGNAMRLACKRLGMESESFRVRWSANNGNAVRGWSLSKAESPK